MTSSRVMRAIFSGGRAVLLAAVLAALLGVQGAPAADEDEGLVTAKAFVILDAKTGRTLLALNPHLMLPPASTLKVMTALMVMERLNLEDKVTVSPYAAAAPASKINLQPGETLTVRDLLYALLLSSANDGARALAEKISGSEEAFAAEATRQMRAWGAYRTRLATANGLPAEGQYSTAEDLALLFRRAIQYPELARIMATKYYSIPGDRELRNHDRFLFTTPLAQGGKTGYTRASRHTYVGRFKNGDQEIIIAMLGSAQKWADMRTLIEKGFELSGAPIAKMEPLEERLWFAKKHTGRYAQAGVRASGKRTKAKVITANITGGGNKKIDRSRKKKSSRYKGGS
ncbi:MAG: serine hydrolase [Syntrophobacterales bacterium]|nr:serine hydrolase [Syntrophobacterales bacterium]